MSRARWIALFVALLFVGILVFAHLAGVEPWTVGAGALALAFAAVTSKFKPTAAAPEIKERARVDEASKVDAAKREADVEAARIVEHRAAESKKPAVDRAQALIDRNRARRVE